MGVSAFILKIMFFRNMIFYHYKRIRISFESIVLCCSRGDVGKSQAEAEEDRGSNPVKANNFFHKNDLRPFPTRKSGVGNVANTSSFSGSVNSSSTT